MRIFALRTEVWPIDGVFRIARSAQTMAQVVVVELSDGAVTGRGEAVPVDRYNQSPKQSCAALEALRPQIEAGLDRRALQNALPPGAARNALDCALWDLEAKQAGKQVWELTGLPAPQPVETVFTISLDTPEAMAAAAQASGRSFLKLKLGAPGDDARLRAVRTALPNARLVCDANEGWTPEKLANLAPLAAELKIELIEQPLPAGADDILQDFASPVPLCADESFLTAGDLERAALLYDAVNIKLDKTGGLTEALAAAHGAKEKGLDIFLGCMVGTSLGMAPSLVLAGMAKFVDLDGPLLLAKDRIPGLTYRDGWIDPPSASLWG